MKIPQDRVLTVDEVARLLKTTRSAVNLMASEARLGAFKIGGKWRFSRNHVLEWIRTQAHTNQPYLGRVILEFLDDGVAIINQDLKVVNCNNAYLRRYHIRREQAIGAACYRVSQGRKTACPAATCPVRAAFKLQKPVKMVHRHPGRGGRTFYSDIMALPLKYGDEPACEVLEVSRDNTEAHRLNERLNWTLNFIAHELQGALGNAVLNVSALLDRKVARAVSPANRREMLESAMSSLKFIRDMARNYLIFSRAHAGQLLFRPRPVDFERDVLSPVLTGLKPALAQRRLRVVKRLSRRRRVFCDQDLLHIALNNLINNAAKYATPGTTIVCRAGKSKTVLEFSIQNWGPAIPKERSTDIFQEFVRLNPAGNPGTGLGLFVVKKIAQLHGGKVVVHCIPARGAAARRGRPDALVTFTLTIPQNPHQRMKETK